MAVPAEARRREGRVKQGGNTEAFGLSSLNGKPFGRRAFLMDILLRPWLEADAAACAALADDEGVAANLRDVFPHPYT